MKGITEPSNDPISTSSRAPLSETTSISDMRFTSNLVLMFHSQHWVVYILESGKPNLMLTGSVGKFDGPYHTPTIFFLGFTMLYVKLYHKHLRVSDIESSDSKSSNDILSLMRDKYNSMLLFQIVYCFGKSRHI